MAANSPILSVITPVLNGAAYLPACLASVARLAEEMPGQTEHIIADGGSTDATLDLARAALDSTASPVSLVLEGPDRGQSHAINRALEYARGDWIAWLNADDEFVPTAVEFLHDLASDRLAGAGVVVGRCRFVDAAGRVVFEPSPPTLSDAGELLRPLSKWFNGRCIVQPEAFIRREAMQAVGGLDESNHLAMDHDLWLRLIETGVRFESVDTHVAIQRVHPGQKTANNLGVARQIVANCRRHLALGASEVETDAAEIDELARRIAVVEDVLKSTNGSSFQDRLGIESSMVEALSSVNRGDGRAFTVGEAAYRAARSRGWAATRLSASASGAAAVDRDGVLAIDCTSPACTQELLKQVVRDGGPRAVVMGGCSTCSGLQRAREGIERTLGDRVTLAGAPWSDDLVRGASSVMGWVNSRMPKVIDDSLFAGLRRIPIDGWPIRDDVLRALSVNANDLASTIVLRRL
ncbi:MAG: glycosyltransferase family 2 protein [Planctomycetota bacterium]